MGPKATSILHCERGQDVGGPMDSIDWLCGGSVSLELHVLNLLCNIVRYSSRVLEDSVSVCCRHHTVQNQVVASREEVEDSHIL